MGTHSHGQIPLLYVRPASKQLSANSLVTRSQSYLLDEYAFYALLAHKTELQPPMTIHRHSKI